MTSTTSVATPRASIYLKQLCRHFGHKTEATFDDTDGRIAFSFGVCELHAGGGELRLTATADDVESRARVEHVIGSHLERFAHREELTVSWPG